MIFWGPESCRMWWKSRPKTCEYFEICKKQLNFAGTTCQWFQVFESAKIGFPQMGWNPRPANSRRKRLKEMLRSRMGGLKKGSVKISRHHSNHYVHLQPQPFSVFFSSVLSLFSMDPFVVSWWHPHSTVRQLYRRRPPCVLTWRVAYAWLWEQVMLRCASVGEEWKIQIFFNKWVLVEFGKNVEDFPQKRCWLEQWTRDALLHWWQVPIRSPKDRYTVGNR